MDDPAQRKAAQIICTQCRTKRFFLHVAEGEVEATCAECGARLYNLTRGMLMIPAQP